MFRNYLTIAIRNLMRYKAYSFINIAGLAIGMACCALISLYILHELSYDAIHSKGDRIYRVLREVRDDEGIATIYSGLSGAFAPALIQDFPEVEEGMRFTGTLVGFVQYGDAIFEQTRAYAAEPNFFRIFDYPLILGDRETALLNPYSVVITEEIARQYFGDTDPIGKVITFTDGRFPGDYTVTGVIRRPENTSIQFEMLCSLHSTTIVDNWMKGHWEDWQPTALNPPFGTFVLLRAGVNPKEIEKKLPDFIERQTGREARERNVYHLQPLHRLHLYAGTDYSSILDVRGTMMVRYGDIQTIYLFSVIAFLIMLIACVNFMNLATARSANRAKEVGLRKVSGAYRLQLVRQFLGEAVLLSSLSFVLALGLVELTLPVFGEFIGKDITPERSVYHVLIFGALAVVVGIIAGIYPAFFLSAFEPIAVLKGQLKMGLKGAFLRKGLVVFQFAMSILLIIGTLMVYRQVQYMQNKKLGFQPDHLIAMSIFWYDGQKKRYDPENKLTWRYNTVKEAFLTHPNVLNATAYRTPPGDNQWQWIWRSVRTETDDTFQMMIQEMDEDFLATYKMDLIAGRPLQVHDMVGAPDKVLLNETAVRVLGWEDPIGKQLSWDNTRATVIGVVKDFHSHSLHENIKPIVLWNRYSAFYFLSVRIKKEDVPTTLAFLEQTWKQFLPDRPFKFSFVDERLNQLYHEDQRVGKVVGIFALLTMVVACLGLFGLAAFTAEQRTKEIGIRKVLGASVSSIVLLLSKEFAGLVLIANLMAWPAAYFAVNHWLQNFAYRVDVPWWIFALSGMAALLIALGTIGFQAIRAALTNPIDALRYE